MLHSWMILTWWQRQQLWLATCGALLAACTQSATHANSSHTPDAAGQDAPEHQDIAPDVPVLDCVPQPLPAALEQVGQQNGRRLLPGGRALTPAGVEVALGGFPIDLRMHPTLPLAYVANTGYDKRSIQVISTQTGAIVQEVARDDAFYGIALAADGKRLYASGGYAAKVDIYDVDAQGQLAAAAQVPLTHYPSGIALSADGKKFWVGQFQAPTTATPGPTEPAGRDVVEFDAQTLAVLRVFHLSIAPYSLLELPARQELWVSGISADHLVAVNLQDGTQSEVAVGMGAVQMATNADESLLYTAVANLDLVVAVDTANRAVVGSQRLGEASIGDEQGQPLPAISPSGLTIHPKVSLLFVTRAADNAVQILNAKDLSPLGAIPAGWYPNAVALTPDGLRLVVLNGKGLGTGPVAAYAQNEESGKQMMNGSVSLIDWSDLDMPKMTPQVLANVRRPDTVFPFQCDAPFPIPAHRGGATPIEHIVLIVKENKTYDSLLGDVGSGNGDPKLAMYGENVTPNLHALARQYTSHDNFYADAESSVQGHLWLTSSFVNDYMERTWFEDYRNRPGWDKDAVLPFGRPSFLTFFTHLMAHNIDFKMFGEVVGAFDSHDGNPVSDHVDLTFPGPFFNTDISDVEKANHVADVLVDQGDFPPFVYVLLPNDHTHGLSAGALTPEAMINDNDVGMGTLVDRITHSKYFATTAIFIVEDDPQQGADHVDYHRSVCVVVSPYAKPGYVSHVHTSFPSLFRSFELMLNLPPMNRYDALATPMWDAFQQTSTQTEFAHIPRTIADEKNKDGTLGARISRQMDFGGPDRNPDLGDLLRWHATGQVRQGSRIARIVAGELPPSAVRMHPGEDDGDDDLYDQEMERFRSFLAAHPDVKVDKRLRAKEGSK